jgi:membrane protein DedA with SNARE-associated domain/rhodanese-related sulfurtransferase
MDSLLHLIAVYGLVVVFVTVLLDQGGIPVPAYPAIVVTSALAWTDGKPVWPILAVATVAAVMADWVWFTGGRRFGNRLVRLMCKLSLSPDSCVTRTRGAFVKYGVASLIVAKFVPGFAAVATTLAGQSGTRTRTFLFFDGIGAALWAGGAVALGVIFNDAVDDLLVNLADLGHMALPVLLALIAAYIAWKWGRRQWFLRQLHMARVSSTELAQLIDSGNAPLILDVRNEADRRSTGWIPGAVFVTTPEEAMATPHQTVVVYCDCPNEASAALLALAIQKRGFRNVRPLAGGVSGWLAEGRPVENAMELHGA